MKKKIFGAALIAAMALAAGWNFNQSKNEVSLSDLALANVDALASGEGGGGYCPRSGYACIIKFSDGTSTTIMGHWK